MFSIDEVPQSVLEDVRLGIQHYFVPLLVISPGDRKHPVDLAGSGTLVELAGRQLRQGATDCSSAGVAT
jgi:hypothetical protein